MKTAHTIRDQLTMVKEQPNVIIKKKKKNTFHVTKNVQSSNLKPVTTNLSCRERFRIAMATYCTSNEFDSIGVDLLMDESFFKGFILRVEQNADEENMEYFFRSEIANAMNAKASQNIVTSNVTQLFPQTESNIMTNQNETKTINVTMEQSKNVNVPFTSTVPAEDGSVTKIDKNVDVNVTKTKNILKDIVAGAEEMGDKAKKLESIEPTVAPAEPSVMVTIGKTVGIAALGAAVGAAGMWAFKRFFG